MARVPESLATKTQVRNVNTNEGLTAQSQFDCEYTVSNLSPGTFEVTVGKDGVRAIPTAPGPP
jgi:hypothetical protein